MANAETEQEPRKKLLVEENMNKRSFVMVGKTERTMGTNGEGTYFQ